MRPRRRALLGLALAASGVVVVAIGTHALTNDPASLRAQAADTRVTGQPMSTAGPLSCAISTVPTLDTAAIPLSTITDGSPYVISCEDPTGHDVINQVAIHNPGRPSTVPPHSPDR